MDGDRSDLALVDQLAICVAGELFGWPMPWPCRSDQRDALALVDGLPADEAEGLIADAYLRAHHILIEHRDKVIALAERLIEVAISTRPGFRRLMASGCLQRQRSFPILCPLVN
jgi:hypothetical protein